MQNYKVEYSELLEFFNEELSEYLDKKTKDYEQTLKEGVRYAIEGGGKRIRPVLCLMTAKILGVPVREALPFAIANEMIHSYSLVHDDLPAMDNDDYRRGKLSTHKKFGEANGILIGDALLNLAFETMTENYSTFDAKKAKAAYILSSAAGAAGMIRGQVLDLKNEKNPVKDEKVLYDIYINKTSRLLTAPLLIASALSGDKYFSELKEYGETLGVLFQITDDILDEEGSLSDIGKTPHKDKEADKFTSIKIYGLAGAKSKAKELFDRCVFIIKDIPNAEVLSELSSAVFYRKK